MNEKKNEEAGDIGLSKKPNAPHDTKKTNVSHDTKKTNAKLTEKKPTKEQILQKDSNLKPKATKTQNAKPAKTQNVKPPSKTSRKQPSNNKLDSAPKSTSSSNNANIAQELVENKRKSVSQHEEATNTPTINTTDSHINNKSNIEKKKKYIPRAYKPKNTEENNVKLDSTPPSNTNNSREKIINNLDNSTMTPNINVASSPRAKTGLIKSKAKVDSNILSNDVSPIDNDNNVPSQFKKTLAKHNNIRRANTNFKKIKPLRNTNPNVGTFNYNEQLPLEIEQAKPNGHHINKAKTHIKQDQDTANKTYTSLNQNQIDVPQKPIQKTQRLAPEQNSINQAQNGLEHEQSSTEQAQSKTIQGQKNIHNAQAKSRIPRKYSGARHNAPKEILNEQDAHGENITNIEGSSLNASNIPLEQVQTKQENIKDKIAKKDIAPKTLPKVAKQRQCKMLISVVPGEQVEVIVLENNTINEYYLEMSNQKKTKGNIYKGIIHNIDTNLQAAFINYGTNKNGFLQIDEVHPEYYISPQVQTKGKKFPPMQKVLKTKQEVLVQVVKEPSGSKGAFLTTWPSLAGRFLVLTPGQTQIGVSRKVIDEGERLRLRNMINGIEPGEGLGVIIRTASEGISKTTLKNDLQYLKRLWKEIRKKVVSETAPSIVYQELALAERAMRDYLNDDIFEVWVDDASVADSLRITASLLFPRKKNLVKVHTDMKQSLWEKFNIQQQLEQIYSREVILPSGGRLIFDQTEALMAIDINSGKISGKNNFEMMALKTNIEAAECIAHQLKLRDVGGQIVIDFIEMRDKKHIRDVEKTLTHAMRNDRARHDVGRISSFGLLELVRQRTASSAIAVSTEPCPLCEGTGIRRNIEWQALQTIRNISRSITHEKKSVHQVILPTELALYFLNHKRESIHALENQYGVKIDIKLKP